MDPLVGNIRTYAIQMETFDKQISIGHQVLHKLLTIDIFCSKPSDIKRQNDTQSRHIVRNVHQNRIRQTQ